MCAVTGYENGSLKAIGVINPTRTPIFETHLQKSSVTCISSHEQCIASLSSDGTICVWNGSGELLKKMEQVGLCYLTHFY